MGWRHRIIGVFLATVMAGGEVRAEIAAEGAPPEEELRSLLHLSLDRLSDIVVTSVGKRDMPVTQAAAAVFVISSEDIRRSGATSIPEALRLAPGVHVARSGSNRWAVSARGFTDQFANKLLVLIDGREIYDPLFSGTFWDVQDTVLEDIERIEVIRGPGGTLWGANAVNGVINIITRKASETQGNLLVAGGGNEERGFTTARHGGTVGENGHYRVYGKWFERGDTESTNAAVPLDDDWRSWRGGFRADWNDRHRRCAEQTKTCGANYTVQGDAYQQSMDNTLLIPSLSAPYYAAVPDVENTTGFNLLGRMTQATNAGEWSLKSHLDYVERRVAVFEQKRWTADFDFQYHLTDLGAHDVVWGAGARFYRDDLKGTYYLNHVPQQSYEQLFNAFIQDEIELADNLHLTPGTKVEWNSFHGFDVQPSVRLSWEAWEGQTFWAAVSRAVRSPSRSNEDVHFIAATNPAVPAFVQINGNKRTKPEELTAYELGYRLLMNRRFTGDVSLFYFDYDNIATSPLGTPFVNFSSPLPPHLVVPATVANGMTAKVYGGEISGEWSVYDNWRLSASYSLVEMDLTTTDFVLTSSPGRTPQHMAYLRSQWTIADGWEWDHIAYYYDNLTAANIDAFIRFDTRLAWKPNDNLEFSLVGQNLFDDSHPEFSAFLYNTPSEIGRSVYGKMTLRF